MFSRWRERLQHTLGFRLALWYAVVFVASSLAIIALTYLLLALSLRRYDREIIQSTLLQYASRMRRAASTRSRARSSERRPPAVANHSSSAPWARGRTSSS